MRHILDYIFHVEEWKGLIYATNTIWPNAYCVRYLNTFSSADKVIRMKVNLSISLATGLCVLFIFATHCTFSTEINTRISPKRAGDVKKWFWRVLLFITYSAIVYNLTVTMMEYSSFNVSEMRQVVHATQMVFPAVTICNMCPVRQSALERNPHLVDRNKRDVVEASEPSMAKSRRKRSAGDAMF